MRTKILFAVLCPILVGACSTTPWKSDYSCPGMSSGVVCKSPIEVYKLTENTDRLTRDGANDGDQSASALSSGSTSAKASSLFLPSQITAGQSLPKEALPVLEPARVMRIWIAPYIDAKEDLRMPGYVLTEVTPRRWSFGEAAALKTKPLLPLQMEFQSRNQPDADGASIEVGEEAKTLTPRGLIQGMQQQSGSSKQPGQQK